MLTLRRYTEVKAMNLNHSIRPLQMPAYSSYVCSSEFEITDLLRREIRYDFTCQFYTDWSTANDQKAPCTSQFPIRCIQLASDIKQVFSARRVHVPLNVRRHPTSNLFVLCPNLISIFSTQRRAGSGHD